MTLLAEAYDKAQPNGNLSLKVVFTTQAVKLARNQHADTAWSQELTETLGAALVEGPELTHEFCFAQLPHGLPPQPFTQGSMPAVLAIPLAEQTIAEQALPAPASPVAEASPVAVVVAASPTPVAVASPVAVAVAAAAAPHAPVAAALPHAIKPDRTFNEVVIDLRLQMGLKAATVLELIEQASTWGLDLPAGSSTPRDKINAIARQLNIPT